MLSNTAIFHPTLWIQEVLISSTTYQMCCPSQLKTLWRGTEETCQPQLGLCQEVSGRGAISHPQSHTAVLTLRVQSGVSNVVGLKYLQSVTGWKGRILVVKIIILFIKKHTVHASLFPSHLAVSSQKNSNAKWHSSPLQGENGEENTKFWKCPMKPKDSTNNVIHSTKSDQFQKPLSLSKHSTF